MKIPSKKDTWLLPCFGVIILVMISSCVLYIRSSGIADSIPFFLITVIVSGLLLWVWFGTYYVITEDTLIAKSGPFKWSIPLRKIKSVKTSNNPISSPALSLKRIEIKYGQFRTVYISPIDREEFTILLQKRCPNVEIPIEK
jgi:hypothetical protein